MIAGQATRPKRYPVLVAVLIPVLLSFRLVGGYFCAKQLICANKITADGIVTFENAEPVGSI